MPWILRQTRWVLLFILFCFPSYSFEPVRAKLGLGTICAFGLAIFSGHLYGPNFFIDHIRNFSTGRNPRHVLFDVLRLDDWYGPQLGGLRGLSVLDIGAGTSETARYLDEEFQIAGAKQLDWWYGGSWKERWGAGTTDLDPVTLKRFLSVNEKYVVKGTAQKLPFKDNSFDLVVSSYSTLYLDPAETLKAANETRRVLKPGGRARFAPIFQSTDRVYDKIGKIRNLFDVESIPYLLRRRPDLEGFQRDLTNWELILTKGPIEEFPIP